MSAGVSSKELETSPFGSRFLIEVNKSLKATQHDTLPVKESLKRSPFSHVHVIHKGEQEPTGHRLATLSLVPKKTSLQVTDHSGHLRVFRLVNNSTTGHHWVTPDQ